MRTPKNIYGRDFANHLIRQWAFLELRQTGSHIILRTEQPFGLTISVPAHKPLRAGTLRGILTMVAAHKRVEPAEILSGL